MLPALPKHNPPPPPPQKNIHSYGKIGKQIVQAAKAGGADPIANARLREVLRLVRARWLVFLNAF